MSNNTIRLGCYLTGSVLRIEFEEEGVIRPFHVEREIDMDAVKTLCAELIRMLNRIDAEGGRRPDLLERLSEISASIGDKLLTSRIINEIVNSRARFLILKTDAGLVHIPWELLYIGDDFLCMKFAMGREVSDVSGVRYTAHHSDGPLKLLIIADPEKNLPCAEKEKKQLRDMIGEIDPDKRLIDLRSLPRTKMNRASLMERIRSHNIIHYAGHGEFHPDIAEKNGWKLPDGVFSASDVQSMISGRMPGLIFSNACQSARSEEWKNTDINLITAFLRAGVRHYIGTSWKILDKPGGLFALSFYKCLIPDAAIGEAVRTARLDLRRDNPYSVEWASYVLYGDPREVYFKRASEETVSETGEWRPAYTENLNIPRSGGNGFSGRRTADNQKPDSKLNLLYVFISVLILLSAYFGYGYFKGNEKDLTETRPDPEIVRLMLEKAKDRKQRIDDLFGKLQEKGVEFIRTDTESPDGWTSTPVYMFLNYDPEALYSVKGLNTLVKHTIQKAIHDSYPRIRMLYRGEYLDQLLEELSRGEAPKSGLKTPNLMLSVEFDHSTDRTHVMMALINISGGEIVDSLTTVIDRDQFITEQSDQLTQALIEKLKRHFPLRGVITGLSEDKAELNIGSEQGVKIGQVFVTESSGKKLEIVESAKFTSIARPADNGMVIEKGCKTMLAIQN